MVYRKRTNPGLICSNCGKPALFMYQRWTRCGKEGTKHYYWYTCHFDPRKFKIEELDYLLGMRKTKGKGYRWCRNITDPQGYIDTYYDGTKHRKY